MKEAEVQKAVKKYMDAKYPQVLAFGRWDAPKLNSRKKHQNARMVQAQKAQGLVTKLPDWWVMAPRGKFHGLMIELKAPGKGAFHWMPRKKCFMIQGNEHYAEQGVRLEQLNNAGYFACFAEGFDEARAVIDWYMLSAVDPENYFEQFTYDWGHYVPITVTIPKINQKTLINVCV